VYMRSAAPDSGVRSAKRRHSSGTAVRIPHDGQLAAKQSYPLEKEAFGLFNYGEKCHLGNRIIEC